MKETARKAFIFSHGVYTDYPYQANNYGLPGTVVAENLAGFLRAKMKGAPSHNNFNEWVYSTLGGGIAKNFMVPYNSKLWKYPLSKLTIEWMGRFVPSPGIDEVMQGIMPRGREGMGYNARFYYPETGGIESVIKGLYARVKNNVYLNAPVKKIDTIKKIVYFGKGQKAQYEKLISTMPLNGFLKLIDDKKAASMGKTLIATNVYCLNVGFKSEGGIDRHWVYVPEAKYPFYRIGFSSEVSGANAPSGCASVFAEVSFKGRPPEGINEKIIKGLMDMEIIKSKKDIVVKYPMVIKDAYVIYNKERERILPKITAMLEKQGIYLAGRWGRWEYSSMEDAVLEGFESADKILNSKVKSQKSKLKTQN
jgi:protoporphyrinogen oxidase